jgi:hypothetical protein
MNKLEAIEELKTHLKKGDTVYTKMMHVSKSGMTRDIQIRKIADDYPYNWTHLASIALDNRIKNDGIRVGGCGMDMGFHLVYNLGYVLYDDGYAFKHSWL